MNELDDFDYLHPIGCDCDECEYENSCDSKCCCRYCMCFVRVEYPGEICGFCISGAHQG